MAQIKLVSPRYNEQLFMAKAIFGEENLTVLDDSYKTIAFNYKHPSGSYVAIGSFIDEFHPKGCGIFTPVFQAWLATYGTLNIDSSEARDQSDSQWRSVNLVLEFTYFFGKETHRFCYRSDDIHHYNKIILHLATLLVRKQMAEMKTQRKKK